VVSRVKMEAIRPHVGERLEDGLNRGEMETFG
jgi:hypothetical protein